MATSSASDKKAFAAAEYLRKHAKFLQGYVVKNVGFEVLDFWIREKELKGRKGPGLFRNSITASIYDDIVKGNKKVVISRPREDLSELDESQLFMELLRDIAKELDVTQLCHKILINVLMLTKSDRGSLFLVRGNSAADFHLVSKLFDVKQDTSFEDAVHSDENMLILPFGKGIVGTVAQTKKPIKLKDVYLDSRFNKEVDQQTGYRTRSLLCMPILNAEDHVIGVAQIMNKADGEEFTERDEEKFRKYLAFAGVGLTNAQLFEMSISECKQNEILLSLARGIFIDQTNLDRLVLRILMDAQGLIRCQRCIMYLVNPTTAKTVQFIKVFDMHCDKGNVIYRPRISTILGSLTTTYATKVVSTCAVQMMDAEQDSSSLQQPFTDYNGYLLHNMMSVPILNHEETVIAVVQIINKANRKAFNEMDVNSLQTFAIYCGLCIHNCQMYEEMSALMSRQKVHLETLSYHVIESQEETTKLVKSAILKAAQYRLYSWNFNDLFYDEFESCKIVLRMFLEMDVLKKFSVDYEVLCRWTLSVKKNYRPVTYHNWRHGLNVAQTMFTMIYTGDMMQYLTELSKFALVVACLCHDLDHRGTNNAFQSEVEHPLALLYCTSTLEHHHFDQCVLLLNSESTAIFQSLSHDDYKMMVNIIESAILATDLALYFKKKGKFIEAASKKDTNWKDPAKNELLRAMMMTACDIAAICKPWELQYKTAHLVASEFFEQGDIERTQLGLEPIALMDRKRQDELPKMQLGFIDAVCLPIYKLLFQINPKMEPMLKGCLANRDNWQALALEFEQASKEKDGNGKAVTNADQASSATNTLPAANTPTSPTSNTITPIITPTNTKTPTDETTNTEKATQDGSQAPHKASCCSLS